MPEECHPVCSKVYFKHGPQTLEMDRQLRPQTKPSKYQASSKQVNDKGSNVSPAAYLPDLIERSALDTAFPTT